MNISSFFVAARIAFAGILTLILFSCNQNSNSTKRAETNDASVIQIRTFQIADSENFGYEILIDEEIYIHQEYIPAIEGKHYFKSQKTATKAAEIVKKKIELNRLPNLSKDEIKRLFRDEIKD